jgi:hypothetical protein
MTKQKLQKDILKEKRKAYLSRLDESVKINDVIAARMKHYDSGITPTLIDTRTSREKNADKNYIYQNQRTEVYKLFNNDREMSEEFLLQLTSSEITPQEFTILYPNLESTFKNKVVEPIEIMTTLRQFALNYNETGTATGQSVTGSVRGSVRGPVSSPVNVPDAPDEESVLTHQTNDSDILARFNERLRSNMVPEKIGEVISGAVSKVEELAVIDENELGELNQELSEQLERLDAILASKSLKNIDQKETNRILKLSEPVFRDLLIKLANGNQDPMTTVGHIIDVVQAMYENMHSVQTKSIEKEEKVSKKAAAKENKETENMIKRSMIEDDLAEELQQLRDYQPYFLPGFSDCTSAITRSNMALRSFINPLY